MLLVEVSARLHVELATQQIGSSCAAVEDVRAEEVAADLLEIGELSQVVGNGGVARLEVAVGIRGGQLLDIATGQVDHHEADEGETQQVHHLLQSEGTGMVSVRARGR